MRESLTNVKELALGSAFFAYLVDIGAYPLPMKARSRYAKALEQLTKQLCTHSAEHLVVLQCDELHRDNAIQQLAKQAALWQPEMGLGVYPDQPPPAAWDDMTLLDRDYSEQMPPLKHTVVLIGGEETGKADAVARMAGTGGLVQVGSSKDSPSLLAEWKQTLLAFIEDEGFRAYPIYIPLFHAGSFTVTADKLWKELAGSCNVYLRESFEDKALLVMTRFNAAEALENFKKSL